MLNEVPQNFVLVSTLFHVLGLSLQLPIEISTFAPYYSVEISALSSLSLISSTNITFFCILYGELFHACFVNATNMSYDAHCHIGVLSMSRVRSFFNDFFRLKRAIVQSAQVEPDPSTGDPSAGDSVFLFAFFR